MGRAEPRQGDRERKVSRTATTIQTSSNRTEEQKTAWQRVDGQRPATKNRMPLGSHGKAVERRKQGKGYLPTRKTQNVTSEAASLARANARAAKIVLGLMIRMRYVLWSYSAYKTSMSHEHQLSVRG